MSQKSALLRAHGRPASVDPKKSKFRLDIQGLRAIAVLAVIADHLITWPRGGFVGVDVFFVISGFLITGQLIRQAERGGSVDFSTFYRARIRRILPAAMATILVTVGIGYFIFRSGRATSTMLDGIFATIFGANWRFAATGTDYWASDGVTSPLQHFWSLSIEEQFYFIWPLIIVAVLWAVKTRRHLMRRALGVTMAVIIVFSFAWAMLETANNPTVAYFSTFSRAWELGIGAMLAIAMPLMAKIPHALRPALAWIGLAGIAGSIFLITDTMAFPGPWAAVPVLATALVIAAGTGGEARFLTPLTNPVTVFIGNISYSLYLWHFPVIIFVEEFVTEWHWSSYLLVFGLILLLSTLSYYFVEQLVLRTNWLLPEKTSKSAKRGHNSLIDHPAQLALVAGLAVAALGAVSAAMYMPQVPPPSAISYTPAAPGTAPVAPTKSEIDPATEAGKLQASISASLTAQSWPELTPSLDNLLTEGKPDEDSDGCGNTDLVKPNCSWDTGKSQTVVVLGDSTGITLLPTVRAALGGTYNIRGMTKAACTALDLVVKDQRPEKMAECKQFKADSIAAINQLKPAIVFITNTSGAMGSLESGTPIESAGNEWRDGTIGELNALAPSGAKLIIVSAPPSGKPPATCATRASSPSDCQYRIPTSFTVAAAASVEAVAATGATHIDTRGWFCSERGDCPAFVGSTPVKRDGVHTTKQYAAQLVPVFKEAVAD